MIDTALTAFANFFVVIDPIGLVPFFLSLTAGMDPEERRRTAFKSVGIAMAILLVFTVVGQPLLRYLGVTLGSFRMASGALLFLLAIDMVVVKENGIRTTTAKEEEEASMRRSEVAVFPLAIPLIAGPGAIAATILLETQNTGHPVAQAATAAVMIAVLLLVGVGFLVATPIMSVLGVTGVNVLTRVLGIVLAALAVNNIVEGLRASFPILGS